MHQQTHSYLRQTSGQRSRRVRASGTQGRGQGRRQLGIAGAERGSQGAGN